MLRRELDNRFLDRSGAAALTPSASPFLRQELHHHQHQHQHQHTHLHQQIIPPAPTATAPLFGAPQPTGLFKDLPKLGESPFYRSALGGVGSYPGYPSSLLHPGLSGSTPFMPPNHLGPFAPKVSSRSDGRMFVSSLPALHNGRYEFFLRSFELCFNADPLFLFLAFLPFIHHLHHHHHHHWLVIDC